MLEDAAGSRHLFGGKTGIVFAPCAIRVVPARAWQFGGAVDAIPVRGIVAGEIVDRPRDAHLPEHREIGGGIGAVGVEERAVPIEEDASELAVWRCRHICEVRLAESDRRMVEDAKAERTLERASKDAGLTGSEL